MIYRCDIYKSKLQKSFCDCKNSHPETSFISHGNSLKVAIWPGNSTFRWPESKLTDFFSCWSLYCFCLSSALSWKVLWGLAFSWIPLSLLFLYQGYTQSAKKKSFSYCLALALFFAYTAIILISYLQVKRHYQRCYHWCNLCVFFDWFDVGLCLYNSGDFSTRCFSLFAGGEHRQQAIHIL